MSWVAWRVCDKKCAYVELTSSGLVQGPKLGRMMQAGAFMASSEMALFQMLGTAEAKHFKEVSKLVREPRPEPPLSNL